MSEWDTFDVSDGGPHQDDPYQDEHYQDLPYHDGTYHDGSDDPLADHGGAEIGAFDHDPAGQTLPTSPDLTGHDPHDPLLSEPLAGPPAEHDTLSADRLDLRSGPGIRDPGPGPGGGRPARQRGPAAVGQRRRAGSHQRRSVHRVDQ